MKLRNAISGFVCAALLAPLSTHSQVALQAGESWSYTFPNAQAFPVTQVLPFTGNSWQTFSFSIQAGSFQPGSQLRYEILQGGLWETEPLSSCYWVTAVTSAVMTVVSPGTVSISHGGDAWMSTSFWQGGGGVRLTMLSGGATIDNVTLHARIQHPGAAGTRSDTEHFLSFPPADGPPVEVSRLNGTQLRVSWPVAYSTYVLEAATNGMAPPCEWRRFTAPPATNSTRAWQDVDAAAGRQFFRVRRR